MGDNGGSGRYALPDSNDNDDDATDDVLCLGHPVRLHLVTMQGTQVVCCYAHPCFKGHTVVAIILETAMVAAEDSYSLPDNDDHDDDANDDALHSGCPVWHATGELTRD
jgi:hypothetical protein